MPKTDAARPRLVVETVEFFFVRVYRLRTDLFNSLLPCVVCSSDDLYIYILDAYCICYYFQFEFNSIRIIRDSFEYVVRYDK